MNIGNLQSNNKDNDHHEDVTVV